MSKFIPSKYQQAVYDAESHDTCHMIINAVAGSGKSTTIVELAKRIDSSKSVIFLAFNRDIVRELKTKLNMPNVQVRTLHSFGLNELRFRFKTFITDRDNMIQNAKYSKIIVQMSQSWGPFLNEDGQPDDAERMSYCTRVEKLVDIMRMCLPQSREELLEFCEKFDVQMFNGEIERAKEVLLAGRSMKNVFDYTDMIYMPAIGDWRLKQYDYVMVDECQDLNRAQQAMVKKMVKPGSGRLIAVGDPHQAIYGFAGADSNSYESLRTMFPNTKEFPLSVCYRCDAGIIDHAKDIVSHIEARDNAPAGEMRQGSFKEIADGDFVLCRNTRPLVSMCLQFIASGRKATIKGNDIGKSLITMAKNTSMKTMDAILNKLNKSVDKAIAKAKEQYPLRTADEVASVANLKDKVAAIQAISDAKKCKNFEDLSAAIAGIFVEDVQGVVFSTMHKSKGLEANNVFIIERFRLPAVFAKKEWEREQESNLDYVARTRAKNKLVYVNDWVSDQDKVKDLKDSLSSIPE